MTFQEEWNLTLLISIYFILFFLYRIFYTENKCLCKISLFFLDLTHLILLGSSPPYSVAYNVVECRRPNESLSKHHPFTHKFRKFYLPKYPFLFRSMVLLIDKKNVQEFFPRRTHAILSHEIQFVNATII